jgi:hypothetical protein
VYKIPTTGTYVPPTPTPVNGSCGIANGTTVSSAPTTNLCSLGNASSVTGSGPWSWTCGGLNGGTTAQCSATKTTVTTPPPSTPTATAPAWFINQTPGTWISIASGAGQRIQDVLPNPIPHSAQLADQPSSITSAWTGGAVDQSRGEYMLCANGGHADYPGNECYALSTRDTTPSWRRLTDPTPNNMFGNLSVEGRTYLDGRPRSMVVFGILFKIV